MARVTLQLDFDPGRISDEISRQNGNYMPLGNRLVDMLLSTVDEKNLETLRIVYGISVVEIEEGTIKIPATIDEARAMHLFAERYLNDFGAGIIDR